MREKFERSMTPKDLDIYEAITDILRIFADTEIGGEYEFDNKVICEYLESLESTIHFAYDTDKDLIYKRFTNDIIAGYPVWRMLKLPEWTSDMIEKSFTDELTAEFNRLSKVYKCLTCKHQVATRGSTGIQIRCDSEFRDKIQDGSTFEPKEICDYYEKSEECGGFVIQ